MTLNFALKNVAPEKIPYIEEMWECWLESRVLISYWMGSDPNPMRQAGLTFADARWIHKFYRDSFVSACHDAGIKAPFFD